MNPGEYHLMASVEERHWWYVGLRDLIARLLRCHLARGFRPRAVLDAGCGTGENLRLLRELLAPAYLGGFDAAQLAVAYASQKNPDADVYLGDICRPELHVAELDLVTSCDVIYIPGADAAVPGLKQLVSALRPGGLFVVNVPAYPWLRSRHDLAVHTSQRFYARDIRNLLAQIGLEPLVLTYRVCSLLPAIVLARLPGMLRPPDNCPDVRSDLFLPNRMLNSMLQSVLCAENSAVVRGCRLPWGSSVFAVGRKV